MKQNSIDVFAHYNLPFQTYFNKEVHSFDETHDETELIWLLRGEARVTCENECYILTPQTLFMINPNQTHSIESFEDTMFITYRFTKSYLNQFQEVYQHLHFVNRVYTLDELVKKYREVPLLISQLIKLLISPNQSTLIRYKIIGYYNMFIYELYTMLLRERYLDIKKKDVPIYIERQNKIINFLNQNFLRKVSLHELAVEIGLSDYRLSHLIKEMFGISFREYIFNIRFEYALRLLRETNFSVIEVSKMSGFSDIKYLNKLLKERFKTTALKYRKRFQNKVQDKISDTKFLEDFFQELRYCLVRLEEKGITNKDLVF